MRTPVTMSIPEAFDRRWRSLNSATKTIRGSFQLVGNHAASRIAKDRRNGVLQHDVCVFHSSHAFVDSLRSLSGVFVGEHILKVHAPVRANDVRRSLVVSCRCSGTMETALPALHVLEDLVERSGGRARQFDFATFGLNFCRSLPVLNWRSTGIWVSSLAEIPFGRAVAAFSGEVLATRMP